MSKARRPFAGIMICFSVGIFLSSFISMSFAFVLGMCGLTLLPGAVFFKRKTISQIFLCAAFVCFGAMIYIHSQHRAEDHIERIAKYYHYKPVMIEGIVSSDIVKKSAFRGTKTVFELELKRIKRREEGPGPHKSSRIYRWQSVSGKILVNIFRDADIAYGDKIIIEGKLHKPFRFDSSSKFSYENFLKRKGISYLLSVKRSGSLDVIASDRGHKIFAVSLKIKNHLKEIIGRYFSDVEGGLLQALVIGDRYDIPKAVNDLFVRTGTAHVLAVSGFNVGIVAFLFFLILKMFPLGRRTQYVITIILIIGYAFLTGLKPPVVRATIMAVIFILSFILERESDTLNSLFLAALIILALNPMNLFDVGFQLSFISVLTIILFYPRVIPWFEKFPVLMKSRPVFFLIQTFAVSLSAWLGVIGLIAYYFEIFTPVSILANLVIVPLISVITILGLGLLFFGAIPAMGIAFAACIKILLNLTVGVIYVFSLIPGACFYLKGFPLWPVIVYYMILALLLNFPHKNHPLTK